MRDGWEEGKGNGPNNVNKWEQRSNSRPKCLSSIQFVLVFCPIKLMHLNIHCFKCVFGLYTTSVVKTLKVYLNSKNIFFFCQTLYISLIVKNTPETPGWSASNFHFNEIMCIYEKIRCTDETPHDQRGMYQPLFCAKVIMFSHWEGDFVLTIGQADKDISLFLKTMSIFVQFKEIITEHLNWEKPSGFYRACHS